MIKRGPFIGLAAGAAVGASMNSAVARNERVPENDPAIIVRRVRIPEGASALPAYSASPRNAQADTPGVVVVLHIWGVDESIRETVRGFAKAGFAAVAPDLFARFGAPSGDGHSDYTTFLPFAQKLQPGQVDDDLRAAAQWLRSMHPSGKVGVTGFCMGGAIALRQAVDNAGVFAADAVFYGKPNVDPAKVAIPVLGSYGEDDHGITVQSVQDFYSKLHVQNEVQIYPGAGHAFMDRERRSYDAGAAADAWTRTIAFFTKYLQTQSE